MVKSFVAVRVAPEAGRPPGPAWDSQDARARDHDGDDDGVSQTRGKRRIVFYAGAAIHHPLKGNYDRNALVSGAVSG